MPQFFETHFDERSGFIPCNTPWGFWYQTVAEVHIEINVEPGTSAKAIKVECSPKHISVKVNDKIIIKGELFSMVFEDDMLWTLEDKKTVHIVLAKADLKIKETIWTSLLMGQYEADPWIQHEMRKKLDLERFEIENPGFNFSRAKLQKSYDQPPATAIAEWKEREQRILAEMEKEKSKAVEENVSNNTPECSSSVPSENTS